MTTPVPLHDVTPAGLKATSFSGELAELADLTDELGPWNAAVADGWQTDPPLCTASDPFDEPASVVVTVSVAPEPVLCERSGLLGFVQRIFDRRP